MNTNFIIEIAGMRNKTVSQPSAELLNLLLRYNPETGKIYWRELPLWFFVDGYYSADDNCRIWNRKYTGKEAFTYTTPSGYKSGRIFKRGYLAHRIIYAMHHGFWPPKDIDHINHDRANNRIKNLRAVTRTENTKNQSIRASNTSGFTGVWWDKAAGKWRASINATGKTIFLGVFTNIKDAIDAREAANTEYDYHENHGS